MTKISSNHGTKKKGNKNSFSNPKTITNNWISSFFNEGTNKMETVTAVVPSVPPTLTVPLIAHDYSLSPFFYNDKQPLVHNDMTRHSNRKHSNQKQESSHFKSPSISSFWDPTAVDTTITPSNFNTANTPTATLNTSNNKTNASHTLGANTPTATLNTSNNKTNASHTLGANTPTATLTTSNNKTNASHTLGSKRKYEVLASIALTAMRDMNNNNDVISSGEPKNQSNTDKDRDISQEAIDNQIAKLPCVYDINTLKVSLHLYLILLLLSL